MTAILTNFFVNNSKASLMISCLLDLFDQSKIIKFYYNSLKQLSINLNKDMF